MEIGPMHARNAAHNRRKGFLHSLEGTIAALLLFFYALQLFSSMNAERTDWTAGASKQEMQEFLIAAKDSSYRNLLYNGKLDEFTGISRYFLGEVRGYSVKVSGIPKTFFEAGVITNNTFTRLGTRNTTQCPSLPMPIEFSCYNGTFQGVKYVLVDQDGGSRNSKEDYDSIYFDFDANGAYNSTEGPYSETSIVKLGSSYWAIGKIYNSSGNVSFWDANRLLQIRGNINDISINWRRTNISVRGATFGTGIMGFDAIIIPGNINVSPYESQLLDFMQAGGGIIELRNITSAGDITSAERNVFGLMWVNNGTVATDTNGSLSFTVPGKPAYNARKYFIASGIFADTYSTDTTGYAVTGITNADSAHIGNITLRRQTYGVLVTKAVASGAYNRVRFDVSQPRYNFSDEPAYSVGQSLIIDGNNYTIKEIDPDGLSATVTGKENYSFSNFLPDATKVYPASGSEDYIFAKAKSKNYSITARTQGSETITAATACTGGEPTMPPGTHKCGTFSAGVSYPFSITNSSANYTWLNIDWNLNGMYNDRGDGPFMTGDAILFGPELYRAYIDPRGMNVRWVLEDRWAVPYATMNYQGLGAAVWMPDTLSSRDEWSLFISALVSAGGNLMQNAKGSAIGKWVDAKSVFFESNETYQPYRVDLKMWY